MIWPLPVDIDYTLQAITAGPKKKRKRHSVHAHFEVKEFGGSGPKKPDDELKNCIGLSRGDERSTAGLKANTLTAAVSSGARLPQVAERQLAASALTIQEREEKDTEQAPNGRARRRRLPQRRLWPG